MMLKFIKNNEQLLAHLPNSVKAVQGETLLFDKIIPFVSEAENWVIFNFCGNLVDFFADSDKHFNYLLKRIVALHALFHAVPSLDLVLTPNGFGVVSTSNIAPASKDRVEAFRNSLLQSRDNNIDMFLRIANTIEQWRNSPIGEWFHRSLFAYPSDVWQFCLYDDFRKFVDAAVMYEDIIAAEAVSPELMARLRKNRHVSESGYSHWLVSEIMGVVKDSIEGNFDENKHLYDLRISNMMDRIMKLPSEFPEFHSSDTKKLFEFKGFKNKKRASGYFF